MSVRYRMLFIMTGAQMCASVVQHGYGALAPFIVGHFHLTNAQFGLSFTVFICGSAVAGAMSGLLVDRFGERTMVMLGGVAVFVVLSIAALVPSYSWFVFTLFWLGIAYAALAPAGGRVILGWFTTDRGFAMGIRQAGIPCGAAIGGLVLPFLAFHYDYRTALFAGALFALVGTAGLPLFYREPAIDAKPLRGFTAYFAGVREIMADPRTVPFVLACMILTSTMQLSSGFIALTAVALGHTGVVVASFVFAMAQVGAVVGRLVWGWASDVPFKGDRTLPTAIICMVGIFGALGFAITMPSNLPLLFVASFVIGFSGSGWTGLFSTGMAEIGGARFAGSALGLANTANFSVAAITPFAFGAVADQLGLRMSWIALAVALALGTIPALVAYQAWKRMRIVQLHGAVETG